MTEFNVVAADKLTQLSSLLNFLALEVSIYVFAVFYRRFGKNGHPVSILGQIGAGLAVVRCGIEVIGHFATEINCNPIVQTILFPVGQVSIAFLYAHFLYKRRLIHPPDEKWQKAEYFTGFFIVLGYLLPSVVSFVITVEYRSDPNVPAGDFGSKECPMGWVPTWVPLLSYALTIIANILTTYLFVSHLHTEGRLATAEYQESSRFRKYLRILNSKKLPWESQERYLARRTFLASLRSVLTTLIIIILFLSVLPIQLYTSFVLLDLGLSWCWATFALPLPREEVHKASGSTFSLKSFVETERLKQAVGFRFRAGAASTSEKSQGGLR